MAFSHLPSPAASMHSSFAASISNSNNSSATRNRSRSILPQSFSHYCYCFQNSTLDTRRSRQTTTTLWRLHKGFSDTGFSGVGRQNNGSLQFDSNVTKLLTTRELSLSSASSSSWRWTRIRAEESVNERLDSNNSAASSNEEGEQKQQVEAKLDQSVGTEFEASYRNGAFLVSNSQQHKQDHGSQGFEASEKFSLFQIEAQGNKKTAYKLFGVNMTPEMIAIAMVYFVQGILGLSELAISFFLKDDLHLDPAETAFLTGLSALPWLIKPLYGFFSDGVPLFGYRRRSYLVLCGLLGALSWGSLASFVDNKFAATTVILLSSLSVAFADVVADSIVVERARGETQGTSVSLQSLCWGSSAVGGIVSAYFSGSLVETYGVRVVFGITAILPLLTSAAAGLVHEEPLIRDHVSSDFPSLDAPKGPVMTFLDISNSQLGFLWETVKEPSIFLPTMFIFLWQATPISDTAMFFFMTNKLGFGPEFLGRVKLVTAVASLVGVGVYNSYLQDVPLRTVFFWTIVMGTVLGLTQLLLVTGINQSLGISNEWFSIGDSLVLTVLGQVSFMPILVLAAELCPPGVEATLFATLMSISNGGAVLGGLIGAALTQLLGVTSENFQNLALLLVLCNVSSLLPLPFLGLLPTESELKAAAVKAETTLGNIEKMKDE
ncbi:unnamed protein product [Sphagnum jensenii]|uniref:Biopterin transport-related protein BT1 n=1 Tax=Sphagnum jensenii TaxID=128206 RepID=A0ABP1ACS2_9BRYO